MYEKPFEELISLVKALDTKINFLMEDVDNLKEDITQIKFLLENPEEKELSREEALKLWKVERL